MKRVLPIIVVAQFFCTSLWFAGNAILPNIIQTFHLQNDFLAHLTSSVQLGFITGTLIFALLAVADRFSPTRVFFVSAIVAALCNLGMVLPDSNAAFLLTSRFLTGFFLAGIYPVGMKITSDHYEQGLGKSLGWLVGALVLGTAFPHLLKTLTETIDWKSVVYATSFLAILGGGGLYFFVPNGPYRKQAQQLKLTSFLEGFRSKPFRIAAFGYFGHMWELYTFWAFVPVILAFYQAQHPTIKLPVSLLSFCIIASGSLACILGGWFSQRYDVKKVATIALALSCSCCLASPLFLTGNSTVALILFLFFWGMVVIADSPLFSTLIAQNAPVENRGTALTIVNCLGFSLTIVSIQFLHLSMLIFDIHFVFMWLALGPVLGLMALLQKT
ncbi:MAG: MFS transporter [Spirosomataceae bacterium]